MPRSLTDFVPLSRSLTRWQRHALTAGLGFMGLTIAVLVAAVVVGAGDSPFAGWLRTWGTSACYMVAAAVVAFRAWVLPLTRGPWITIAVGTSIYGLGNVVWELWLGKLDNPPIPSLADGLWLSLYPAAYLGILWLVRTEWQHVKVTVWIDGLIAGLGVAAIGSAIVFPRVLETASGDTVAVVTNLAYPVCDLLLAALVTGVFAIRGWRPGRVWALLGAGFLSLTLADSIYLLQVAAGNFESTNVANIFFLAGVSLIAVAAWQPQSGAVRPKLESWSVFLVPSMFVAAAVVLLAFEQFDDLAATVRPLCLLTIIAGFGRTVMSFRDLRTLAETRALALTDDLTGLPNRRHFMQRLGTVIDEAEAENATCALLLIDVDQFKELNDTLGHAAGDELLRQLGPRLRSALRTSDTLARLGGDEFGIVIPFPTSEDAARGVADKVHVSLADPFSIQGLRLQVNVSIGISLFPDHGRRDLELLRFADVALYDAKRTRSRSAVYDQSRDTHSREHLTLANELKEALTRGALNVHFQPKADATTGQILGLEALARWDHPSRGPITPCTFVPVAEHSGLSRDLTTRVLNLALEQCSVWRRAGYDLHVAVNVTVADLVDIDFPEQIAGALARHRLPPEALVIEITEGSVLSDPERTRGILSQLKEAGVGLSLDDFGTGYSSLTHLRALPVDEVKIDRSFVREMATETKDRAIVLATIRLAETLGIRVVAEGVEDEETWQRLAAADCHLIQGYVLSRPVPAADVHALLAAPVVGDRV
ncbi:MAG TPA: EAL domain-containing protein [Baekduia sp.]|nr:EAL domain-containing protein [Baekduia sp.]